MSWPLSVKHAAKITFAQYKCRTFQSIIYPADKNNFIGISSILAWGLGKSRVGLPPPFYCREFFSCALLSERLERASTQQGLATATGSKKAPSSTHQNWKWSFAVALACVASVSHRVIARRLQQEQKTKRWKGEGEGKRGNACPQTPPF